MKKIANLEEYKFMVMGSEGRKQPIIATDGDLLKAPLNNAVLGSKELFTREVLKTLDRICDAIDKAQESKDKILLLENSDYGLLKDRFDKYGGWSTQEGIRKCILKTGEKLDSAEDCAPKKDNPEAEEPAKKEQRKEE